jgi:hypothetical protein
MPSGPSPPLPLTCAICGKPILPKDFNVTEDGNAVHGECYLGRIKERKAEQH